jgi:hypothetical protein
MKFASEIKTDEEEECAGYPTSPNFIRADGKWTG